MKKLSVVKKVTIVLLTLAFIICSAIFFSVNYVFDGLRVNKIDKSSDALGISESPSQQQEEKKDRNVKNIALFGLDSGGKGVFSGRSDSLMILSIDGDNNVLKLTSILRDSYVAIDGHGHEKICHAYSYGGPQLAIKTINKNFNLDIKDYVTVNFSSFENIVDIAGGVELDITQKEMEQINLSSSKRLTRYGKVKLNGEQALHYSRIRVIDSDTVRASRQRNVINALLKRARDNGLLQNVSLIKSVMPMLETSIGQMEVLKYAKQAMGLKREIIQESVPGEAENPIGGMYEGAWVWRYDLKAASKRINKFIYG